MRVVLDPSVLVSAVLFGGLPREILLRALRREFDVVTTVRLNGGVRRRLDGKLWPLTRDRTGGTIRV
ncbi:MAG TPA: hypothetical protein VGR46_14360 [Candidatus Limnocylindria bacterium]|nr:hypothetical protein [Candidatus Limnocylindria bacterium]